MQEKNIALAFLVLVSIGAGAQEDSLRSYGNNDGLANLAVRQLYKDHLGFIWVSTENGIYRFDGDRFQAFDTSHGVPENSAVAFGEAPDGSLLMGGEIGLYRLRDNRFEAVPAPFKTISWAQGIRSDNSGRTYLGSDAGLAELTVQPGSRDRFAIRILPRPPGTSGPQAWGVLVDGDTLWYGCGLELCEIHDGAATVIGREGGLPPRQVTSILKDSQGSLWVTAELTISVNVSARQFGQSDFADRVIAALERTGARPEQLKIELTESSVVENANEVISKMMQLRSFGLRFSLDDFGTGYSSLRYLQRLPIDQLKIDRSFVTDIQNNPVSAAIAQATISLAGAKQVAVIAEGVETDGQRRFLEHLGCFDFQGFLFSRPLPLSEFRCYLGGFPTIVAHRDRPLIEYAAH